MSNLHSDDLSASSTSTSDAATEKLLAELKIRARLRLNALSDADPATIKYAHWIAKKRRWPLPQEWKLQHAFNIVATEMGFRDWEHARRVLSGLAKPGDDMGGFWHDFRCDLLLNHWFANYEDAHELLAKGGYWLFPFGKQFVVGDVNYVRTLKLDPESELWRALQFDLGASYGNEDWQRACIARLNATREQPLPVQGKF